MVMDRARVLQTLSEHGAELREFGVLRLYLFGSLARDEAAETSDIDILVDYRPGMRLSFFRVCDLRYRLEELLGAPVDLVTMSGLRAEIRDEVLSEAIRAA